MPLVFVQHGVSNRKDAEYLQAQAGRRGLNPSLSGGCGEPTTRAVAE